MLTKKILIIISGSILSLLVLLLLNYYYQINASASNESREVEFIVEKGQSVKAISQNLYKQELIRSKRFFEFFVWWTNKQAKLQAGEYRLNSRQTIRQVVDSLGNAKVSTVKIVIKEGESLSEIAQNLEKQGLFSREDFAKEVGADLASGAISKELLNKYDFLKSKPSEASLEGFLFPDTYLVFKKSSANEVVEKILNNFNIKLSESLKQEISRQGKSIYEVITMASILEKEVKTLEDMKVVSGIFWYRIKIGQALQSDATLSYILSDKIASHSLEELKTESLYNSYKYKGLPPTPIGNPGINAIMAAIYPTESEYNFFLSAKDNGQTIFSKTFQEHIANKQKYLK